MIIPKFKERTIPVYFMEDYINEEESSEAKQFKRILNSINDLEKILTVEEMTAILEYEETALNYAFKLAINTLNKRRFEKDFAEIYNAVNDAEFYPKALKSEILFAKYCTLQKILNELLVIHDIKNAVSEIVFKYNNYDRELLQGVTEIQNGMKF